MVKKAHTVTISAFFRNDEHRFTKEQLQESITSFIPETIDTEDFKKEGISLVQEDLSIEDGVDIIKFELTFSKDRNINPLLAQLKELLGEEQSHQVVAQENRIDDNGNCYVRLQKEEWVLNNNTVLTDEGDCIHLKIVTACFPKNKEAARKVVQELFS